MVLVVMFMSVMLLKALLLRKTYLKFTFLQDWTGGIKDKSVGWKFGAQ